MISTLNLCSFVIDKAAVLIIVPNYVGITLCHTATSTRLLSLCLVPLTRNIINIRSFHRAGSRHILNITSRLQFWSGRYRICVEQSGNGKIVIRQCHQCINDTDFFVITISSWTGMTGSLQGSVFHNCCVLSQFHHSVTRT